jgi:hypothetical protein
LLTEAGTYWLTGCCVSYRFAVQRSSDLSPFSSRPPLFSSGLFAALMVFSDALSSKVLKSLGLVSSAVAWLSVGLVEDIVPCVVIVVEYGSDTL